jgi:transposase
MPRFGFVLGKHVERARIVLASAEWEPAQQVAVHAGVSRPTVWRWQQRYAEAEVEGLLCDKTRKPGKARIAAEVTAGVVALTCAAPQHQATHWTGRAMAKATGISLRSLRPHLAGLPIAVASYPHLPTFARSEFLPPSWPTSSALCRSPGLRRLALAQRKKSDPSSRPNPAFTDRARALPDHDI